MSLRITEKWIRKRVGLETENLEDVKTLSLPGTYQEKISRLGNSLQSFSRLHQLDLSRNALQSLEGLNHLPMLEKLNLYYNNIVSLKDLYQLRHNGNLLELDLRLNPVTKNEPDYRLFLVHLLPNLRLLDDRTVRDSERRAALMHFDSDQASLMTAHGFRSGPSDTKSVSSSGLGDDISEMVDLLSSSENLLPDPSMRGSRSKDKSFQLFHGQEISKDKQEPVLDLNQNYTNYSTNLRKSQIRHDGLSNEEPLVYRDDDNGYSSIKVVGHFTPNPRAGNNQTGQEVRDDVPEPDFKDPPSVQRVFEPRQRDKSEELHQKEEELRDVPLCQSNPSPVDKVLTELLHLVDRYWNGSKSLQYHHKFQAQAHHILNYAFLESKAAAMQGHANLKDVLKQRQQEVDNLQDRLQSLLMENEDLNKRLLEAQNKKRSPKRSPVRSPVRVAEVTSMTAEEDILREVEGMRKENERLRMQVKHFTQLQELATMLQESHKSLILTNDHLLAELNDLKDQHFPTMKSMSRSLGERKMTQVYPHNGT